jgi:two-component system, NtrC family, sensor kinase
MQDKFLNFPGRNKDALKVPLFWKFTVGLTVMVLLFGTINILLINRIVYNSLDEELQQRGLSISRMISQRAIDYLLYDDLVALNQLVDEIILSDPSIEYIIVLDRYQQVYAHTFEAGVPADLLAINRVSGETIGTLHITPRGSQKIIRDIAVPLFEGKIGVVRVGLTEETISRTLNQAASTMVGMVIVFFVLGIIGIFVFSFMVTHPVQSIGRIAEGIDMSAIKNKKISFAVRYPKALQKPMNMLPNDELDTLVAKFNEMVARLEDAYDSLEQAHKKLIQSEKLASIGTLASGVAHEVNNPLAGMMHCIERMKKRPKDLENNARLLDLMQDAAHKVDKVVNNLLDFARKSDHLPERVKVTAIFANALLLASHKLEKFRISVDQAHTDQNLTLTGNKNQIEQVVLNLLLNSIDAIADRQARDPSFLGKITLKSHAGQGRVFMEVEDNGVGISGENLNKVVDPFFTTKETGRGTGLGLSISYSIIREHQGEMEISSSPTQGTRVRIWIPIAGPDEQ